MTTIAFDGRVMCGDRCVNSSGTAHVQARKVFDIDGWLLGLAGAAAEVSIIIGFVRSKIASLPAADGVTIDGLLGKTGYSDNESRFIGLLVNPSGKIHILDRDKEGSVFCYAVDALFAAAGSGRDIALGAMAAGASAYEAVEYASQFDCGTGPTADYIELPRTAPSDAGVQIAPASQVSGEGEADDMEIEAPRANQALRDFVAKGQARLEGRPPPEPAIPEGFIPWSGGECPVADGKWVEVITREGVKFKTKVNFEMDARLWANEAAPNDIIAYRILSDPKTEGEGAESLFENQPANTSGQKYPGDLDKAAATSPYCKACLTWLGDDGLCPCCDHNYTIWKGGDGDSPVAQDAFVDVVLRSGGGEGGPAGDMDWAHSIFHTHPNDIVLYRLQSARPKYDEDGMPVRSDEPARNDSGNPADEDGREGERIDRPLIIDPIVEKDEPRNEQSEPYGKDHEDDPDRLDVSGDVGAQAGKMEKAL